MTTLQAIGLGAMLVLTPSLWVCIGCWGLTTDCRRTCAEHILHNGIANSDELAARLRLIGAARRVCVVVGFTVTMNRAPVSIDDDEEGGRRMTNIKNESLSARAGRIERIIQTDYFDEGVAAIDLALEELLKDERRSDGAVAHAVAMRIGTPQAP
jgi:hypothetical protein